MHQTEIATATPAPASDDDVEPSAEGPRRTVAIGVNRRAVASSTSTPSVEAVPDPTAADLVVDARRDAENENEPPDANTNADHENQGPSDSTTTLKPAPNEEVSFAEAAASRPGKGRRASEARPIVSKSPQRPQQRQQARLPPGDDGPEDAPFMVSPASASSAEPGANSPSENENENNNHNTTRVKYDMEQVPYVRKTNGYLDLFPRWPRRRDGGPAETEISQPHRSACSTCRLSRLKPFQDDDCALWIPSSRREWDDTVSEMTAVCASAAWRARVDVDDDAPFVAPLSRAYVRDRIDIDDPLRGFQLRSRNGGWLRGFILWTNFTTWTHYFQWNSLHSSSGMKKAIDYDGDPRLFADIDGSLAKQLDAEPRSGSPDENGIVFGTIAEIALLGALGCGEYLLRMALDDIMASNEFRFVVLQATDGSRRFYEKFGFRRVGAVCRYGSSDKSMKDVPTTLSAPIRGYRHWTHPNEPEQSLDLHGGPSYMMCLELDDAKNRRTPVTSCSACRTPTTMLKEMSKLKVDDKPLIRTLGSMATPGRKPRSIVTMTGRESLAFPNEDCPMPPLVPKSSRPKRVFSPHEERQPPPKRHKAAAAGPPTEEPPPENAHHRKRYHGVRSVTETIRDSPGTRKSSRSRKSTVKAAQLFASETAPPSPRESSRSRKSTVKAFASEPPPEIETAPPPKKSGAVPAMTNPTSALGKVLPDGSRAIDRETLKKQRLKSYPRDREHFFNKVVKRLDDESQPPRYYFVLEYDDPNDGALLVPLVKRGELGGKRRGRPRYRCELGDSDANFVRVPEMSGNYAAVDSHMVMKTSVVSQEAWDVNDARR